LVLRPFDRLRAQGERKKYNEIKSDTARAEPFDFAQDMPFDGAQDMLVETPFASGMSSTDRHWR
jgi:hypothetical protein